MTDPARRPSQPLIETPQSPTLGIEGQQKDPLTEASGGTNPTEHPQSRARAQSAPPDIGGALNEATRLPEEKFEDSYKSAEQLHDRMNRHYNGEYEKNDVQPLGEYGENLANEIIECGSDITKLKQLSDKYQLKYDDDSSEQCNPPKNLEQIFVENSINIVPQKEFSQCASQDSQMIKSCPFLGRTRQEYQFKTYAESTA